MFAYFYSLNVKHAFSMYILCFFLPSFLLSFKDYHTLNTLILNFFLVPLLLVRRKKRKRERFSGGTNPIKILLLIASFN